MGVYIPNMEKPKECKECQWHLGFYIEDEQVGGLCTITEKDDKENTCPLIEIVRCGECEHLEVINKAPIYAHCHKWNYDFELWQEDTRINFCSWGERRADE